MRRTSQVKWIASFLLFVVFYQFAITFFTSSTQPLSQQQRPRRSDFDTHANSEGQATSHSQFERRFKEIRGPRHGIDTLKWPDNSKGAIHNAQSESLYRRMKKFLPGEAVDSKSKKTLPYEVEDESDAEDPLEAARVSTQRVLAVSDNYQPITKRTPRKRTAIREQGSTVDNVQADARLIVASEHSKTSETQIQGRSCWVHAASVGPLTVCPFFFTSQRTTSLLQAAGRKLILEENSMHDIDFEYVGLVTQLSANRLPRLERTVKRWNGPISAALFLDSNTELELVARWHQDFELAAEFLDVHVVLNAPNNTNYPINFLRNIAMNHCIQSMGFVVDADASVSGNCEIFTNEVKLASDASGDDSSNTDLLKRIFIVPALEFTAKLSVPDQESFVVPHEKSEAVRLVSQHVIQPMHKYFPPAYGPTDYARWYKTKAPYEVPYELFFEPYYVSRMTSTYPPRYDERFVNFGKNKAQQAFEMTALGYRMMVLPGVYIVDTLHREASWKRQADMDTMLELFNRFRLEVKDKYGYEYVEKGNGILSHTKTVRVNT